ncbi:MAG: hypothetical protein HY002_05325 [Candidatus Rokubacteria bacterium]|nr:hypothetical protein [Candidatus Rokubacteria bacterium]
MDLRYFELHDLLCEAMIALEAGDYPAAAARVRKALAWAEADWLATPSRLSGAGPRRPAGSGQSDHAADEEE